MNIDPKLLSSYKELFHRNPTVPKITLLVPIPGNGNQEVQVSNDKKTLTYQAEGLPSITIPKKIKTGKNPKEKWAGSPAVRLFIYACHSATIAAMKTQGWKPKIKSIRVVPQEMGFTLDVDATCHIPGIPVLQATWLIQEGKPTQKGGPKILIIPKKDDNWSGNELEIPLDQVNYLDRQIQTQIQKANKWHRAQNEILKADKKQILQAFKKSQTNGRIVRTEIWTHEGAGTSEIQVAIKGISRRVRISSHGTYHKPQKKSWRNTNPPKWISKGPDGHLIFATPQEQNQMWDKEITLANTDERKAKKFLSLLEEIGIKKG